MTKKVSQEEIDRQLSEASSAVELDHGASPNPKGTPANKGAPGESVKGPVLEIETPVAKTPAKIPTRPQFTDERAHPDDRSSFDVRNRRSDGSAKKIAFDFNFVWKVFLAILCLKSWWILLTWGGSFFFKDWPFLGIFRIQPYLVPNLFVGWYFAWKGKELLFKKIGELNSLGESTNRHEIGMHALVFLTFQFPVSLFFAITGLNPILTEHLGVFVALLCNVAIAAALRFYIPRRFPKLNLD